MDKDLLIGWNAAYLFADWLLHFSQDKMLLFQWRYCIRIENLGQEIVQLRERHWRIFSLSGTLETVRGRGVVGQVSLFDEKRRLKKKRQSFLLWGSFPLSYLYPKFKILVISYISTYFPLSRRVYGHLATIQLATKKSTSCQPVRHQLLSLRRAAWEQVKHPGHNNPLVGRGCRLRSRLILGE